MPLYRSNFYFIIRPIRIYIEHYLGGGAEFQNNINCITVDIALISPPPPPPSLSQLTHNHLAMSPFPLLRDVGSTINSWDVQNGQQQQLPLPSPKGCGQAHTCSMVELGGRNTKGDPTSRRPTKCIAKMGYDTCHSLFFSHHFLP